MIAGFFYNVSSEWVRSSNLLITLVQSQIVKDLTILILHLHIKSLGKFKNNCNTHI